MFVSRLKNINFLEDFPHSIINMCYHLRIPREQRKQNNTNVCSMFLDRYVFSNGLFSDNNVIKEADTKAGIHSGVFQGTHEG